MARRMQPTWLMNVIVSLTFSGYATGSKTEKLLELILWPSMSCSMLTRNAGFSAERVDLGSSPPSSGQTSFLSDTWNSSGIAHPSRWLS